MSEITQYSSFSISTVRGLEGESAQILSPPTSSLPFILEPLESDVPWRHPPEAVHELSNVIFSGHFLFFIRANLLVYATWLDHILLFVMLDSWFP